MRSVTREDIWFGRNQPYGYWRVGNPIVKVLVILLIIAGCLSKSPSLMLQGSALAFIMLVAPFQAKSFIRPLLIFGGGSFLVGLLDPAFTPYQRLRPLTNIPGVATVDWQFVVVLAIVFVALFSITRAVTSRDYAWLIDLTPRPWRSTLAGLVHGFAYAIVKAPSSLWEASTSLRARGIEAPFQIRLLLPPPADVMNRFAVWMYQLYIKMEDMARAVEYVLVSRVHVAERKTPIARSWTASDVSLVATLLFGIIGGRIARHLISS